MGSSPISATRPVGQEVKTPPFHGSNTSSILVRVTKKELNRNFDLTLFYSRPKGLCMELPLWAYGITACCVFPFPSVLITYHLRWIPYSLMRDSMPQQVADSMHAYGVIKMRVLSRRLGISSRVSVYIIAEGVYHHAKRVSSAA